MRALGMKANDKSLGLGYGGCAKAGEMERVLIPLSRSLSAVIPHMGTGRDDVIKGPIAASRL